MNMTTNLSMKKGLQKLTIKMLKTKKYLKKLQKKYIIILIM